MEIIEERYGRSSTPITIPLPAVGCSKVDRGRV